jgi:hypothetical protein
MRALVLVWVLLLVSSASRAEGDTSCWDKATRAEISCTPITKELLLSLHFKSRRSVVEAMKAKGRRRSPDEADTLVFVSNANHGGAGSGTLTLTFQDDEVVMVHAFANQPAPPLEYIWNAYLGGCSDFPGSDQKCNK